MTRSSDRLVIGLHGVGASGRDLEGLARVWAPSLPGTRFAFPDAPEPCGMGRQWFSISGVTEENRGGRIRDARPGLDATLSRVIEEHGFAGRLERVALVGFSQGTIMALDGVVTGRWPVGAIVGFSGRLASPEPHSPAIATPVLLVHGEADPVIPVDETQKAAARLAVCGMHVETLVIPGLGHGISAEGAERAVQFLAEKLS